MRRGSFVVFEKASCARRLGGDHEWQVVTRKVSFTVIAFERVLFAGSFDWRIFYYLLLDISHGRKSKTLL